MHIIKQYEVIILSRRASTLLSPQRAIPPQTMPHARGNLIRRVEIVLFPAALLFGRVYVDQTATSSEARTQSICKPSETNRQWRSRARFHYYSGAPLLFRAQKEIARVLSLIFSLSGFNDRPLPGNKKDSRFS